MSSYLKKIDLLVANEPDPAFARRARIILRNLSLRPDQKVLDAGCGRGFYLKALLTLEPKLQIYGLDLNPKYLAVAEKSVSKASVKLIAGDLNHLPFADNFFDRIIASEILEHIPDDRQALKELYRVLKPNGRLVLTVPNQNYPLAWDPLNWILEKTCRRHVPANIWWLAGIWADHVRLYSLADLKAKVCLIGFKIKKSWSVTHYCFPLAHFWLYGLGKNLVERGWFSDCNRFLWPRKESWLSKILLFPLRAIDCLNQEENLSSSVNLLLLLTK